MIVKVFINIESQVNRKILKNLVSIVMKFSTPAVLIPSATLYTMLIINFS